jgi:hypothetical protein
MWRFRAVTATGLALGLVLAVWAAYSISWDGGPSLKPRGSEKWTSESSLLVTQVGFPEGRVTLPSSVPGEADPNPEKLEFADPGRFSALASLYAQLATSDRVRNLLPDRPKPEQIEATAIEGPPNSPVLPVIRLSTTAETPAKAKALNRHTTRALRAMLASGQAQSKIPAAQRIQLAPVNASSRAELTKGRSRTASILAFLLCLLASVAVTHLLAAIRGLEMSDSSPRSGLTSVSSEGSSAAAPPSAAA